MTASMNSFTRYASRVSAVTACAKQVAFRTLLVGIAFSMLAACTTSPSASSSSSTSMLAPALELATGTLNLEGTDLAVDSESAAKLLPLWQLLDELDASSSTAPEEITAVVEEIQLTMNAGQLKAIDAMSLDQVELAASQAGTSSASTSSNGTSSGTQAQSAGAGCCCGLSC